LSLLVLVCQLPVHSLVQPGTYLSVSSVQVVSRLSGCGLLTSSSGSSSLASGPLDRCSGSSWDLRSSSTYEAYSSSELVSSSGSSSCSLDRLVLRGSELSSTPGSGSPSGGPGGQGPFLTSMESLLSCYSLGSGVSLLSRATASSEAPKGELLYSLLLALEALVWRTRLRSPDMSHC
jgi:NADH:ubiquinone oxidoreductase subunit D